MNQYEITYLINPKTGEEDREKLNGGFDAKVSEFEGRVVHTSPTLRRNIGYAIQKTRSAFLRSVNIELDPAKIADIQDLLKRDKDVLRFTILNTPQRAEISQEILAKAQQKPGQKPKKQETPKPVKKVTMEDVEKGIEEALTEEVK